MCDFLLVADSGTTKTDWSVVRVADEKTIAFATEGINPVFQSVKVLDTLICEVARKTFEFVKNGTLAIHYYGAGLSASDEAEEKFLEVLKKYFAQAKIVLASDCTGAAHALCGHNAGVVCIMGTGSNACLYDGEKIVASGRGGGFILGDEGGGANLGKRLVADYVKNLLPTEITEELERDFGFSYSEVINRVYRMPMPNRYLASFAPYIAKHKDNSHIRALIEASFDDFITRNILQYDKKYSMNVVGSMAYYFEDILRSVAQKHNVDVAKILKSPIDELVKFQLTNYKKRD